MGNHEELLQGAGGDAQQRCLLQRLLMALPAALPLDDRDQHRGVEDHPGRPWLS